MLLKAKEAYGLWLAIQRDFPRPERFGLGDRIDSLFIDLLEEIFKSLYVPIARKVEYLERTIATLDRLKFLVQTARENKLIGIKGFTALSVELDEVGRQLGGWRKGLVTKTPTS